MERIYNATKKYLFKDTKYFFLYIYRYFQDNYKHDCKFYSEEEFSNDFKNGKSLIRLGDGEIDLIHFLPIHYQKYSDSIRDDFLKIVKKYNNKSKYILSIPIFLNDTNMELKKANRFQCWMPLKITYELIFNKNIKYFDAHAFYRNGGFEKFIIKNISGKKIIVVTNKKNITDIKNSTDEKNIYDYIECNTENTYEDRGIIKNEIIEKIKKTNLPKNEFVILMSAGLSKTIIYDLSYDGYQILDIGKGLESYYIGISIENLI